MELISVRGRWLGVFNAVSAFNNSGMSLLDANLVFACLFLKHLETNGLQIPFQTSLYTLLTMGLLILAGNTA
jgi:Trk-type K+ transport system membrane component